MLSAKILILRHSKDKGDWDTFETKDQYSNRLCQSSMDELIEETYTNEEFTLEDFFKFSTNWSNSEPSAELG